MKHIKNILFCLGILLFICLSCSKDDNNNNPESLADAKLAVEIKATGAKTKAYNPNDLNELEGEAYINNLAVLIFSEDGSTVLGRKWEAVKTEYTATITDVPAKAAKARILIVANVPENLINGVSSFDDFQNDLVDLASQSQTSLTMSSRVIVTEKALINEDNYLGYESMGTDNVNGISTPIYLTRIPARVDLVSLETNFANSPLEGRSVRIESVSLNNVKSRANYFSNAEWGAVEVDGNLTSSSPATFNFVINDATPVTNTPYSSYVMENTDTENATQIVIRATLLATENASAQTKTFVSTINLNGIENGYSHNLIKRNYVYRLWITFGKNSFDPDTFLDVAVEVVGWGPVNQDVVID
ncbi:fimbrial protein [uncultured Parabacteroides sp.]|uniref:fimbrial protein n=1 Tax=uncultured Parabacteroides sp. TaxID=512312 RepID=UPI00259BE7C6|nr:fimbrial protein [uncultured Parabacteroides sp.]